MNESINQFISQSNIQPINENTAEEVYNVGESFHNFLNFNKFCPVLLEIAFIPLIMRPARNWGHLNVFPEVLWNFVM